MWIKTFLVVLCMMAFGILFVLGNGSCGGHLMAWLKVFLVVLYILMFGILFLLSDGDGPCE